MKRQIISSALALSLVFGGAAALPEGVGSMISNITADAVKQGDFEFKKLDDGTYELSRYLGKSKNVTVPALYDNTKVTGIGTDCFFGNETIRRVYLPSTIRYIDQHAFNIVKNLEGITLPDGLERIGYCAFFGIGHHQMLEEISTKGETRKYDRNETPFMSIDIPDSVTEIEDQAFAEFHHSPKEKDMLTEGFVIIGSAGSAAEKYAKKKGITFKERKNVTDISDADVTIDDSKCVYYYHHDQEKRDDSIKTTVKLNGKTLRRGTDYIIMPRDESKPDEGIEWVSEFGTHTLFIIGIGDYYGTVTKSFTIGEYDISNCEAWDWENDFEYYYTGKAIKSGIELLQPSAKGTNYAYYPLEEGVHYTATYKNNIKPGTATVTFKAIKGSKFKGTKTITFKIKKKTDITKATVTGIKNRLYDGKVKKPVPVVKIGSKTLKKGKDYTVSYKNNKNVGLATVTIKGMGEYDGTLNKTFKITPKMTSLKKVTSPKKGKLKITYKKASGAGGYQIKLSTKKTFTKATTKTVNVKGANTLSKTISGLKKGKKYYVKVRAYKTVGGVKYYGKYSGTHGVFVKK